MAGVFRKLTGGFGVVKYIHAAALPLKWPLVVGRYPVGVVTEPLFEEGEANTGWLIILHVLTPIPEMKQKSGLKCLCCDVNIAVLLGCYVCLVT